MLPALFVDQLESGIAGDATKARTEDPASHQRAAPVTRVSLWSRLVPAALRRKLAERATRRREERNHAALWGMSPHLLNDIGLLQTDVDNLHDELVAAPASVIERRNARTATQEMEVAVVAPLKAVLPIRERLAADRTTPGTFVAGVPNAA